MHQRQCFIEVARGHNSGIDIFLQCTQCRLSTACCYGCAREAFRLLRQILQVHARQWHVPCMDGKDGGTSSAIRWWHFNQPADGDRERGLPTHRGCTLTLESMRGKLLIASAKHDVATPQRRLGVAPHLSKRPGRNKAGSKQSGRLVAPMTTTPTRDCTTATKRV